MSSRARIPDEGARLTERGMLTATSRLFLNVLQGIIDSKIALIYVPKRFDSLELLNEAIPFPYEDMTVQVTNQGKAIYKNDQWVKESDDTTPIT